MVSTHAYTAEEPAFKEIDAAFLVGAMPRKKDMERKDLLAANVKIFASQGNALKQWANPRCKGELSWSTCNSQTLHLFGSLLYISTYHHNRLLTLTQFWSWATQRTRTL